MLKYRSDLKPRARTLRANMTDAEQHLWSRLRRKQVLGVQFYRQKPLGDYVVDFYAPAAKLVIEVDGSQHYDGSHKQNDQSRDNSLRGQGLQVLRFDNLQVLKETEAVMQAIYQAVEAVLRSHKSFLVPPLSDVREAQVPRVQRRAKATKKGRSSRNDDPDIPPFEKGGPGGI